jgi:hypothetical protein
MPTNQDRLQKALLRVRVLRPREQEQQDTLKKLANHHQLLALCQDPSIYLHHLHSHMLYLNFWDNTAQDLHQ